MTGSHQLKRTNDGETLRVTKGASLAIDGITVTHQPGATGSGIIVYGQLSLVGGSVTGNNSTVSGGGVLVESQDPAYPAAFAMSGGDISNNKAKGGGGIGIYSGSFTLTGGAVFGNVAEGSTFSSSGNDYSMGGGVYNGGGLVSGNQAERGGGIWNASGSIGQLTISAGTISNNTASNMGGGVGNAAFLDMSGGVISNNKTLANGMGGGIWSRYVVNLTGGTISNNSADNGGGIYLDGDFSQSTISNAIISGNSASANGGGVWVAQSNLDKLSVAAGTAFSNNSADKPHDRLPKDDAHYQAQVQASSWTSPFVQGYNNYDISYTGLIVTRSVGLGNSFAISSGSGHYDFGDIVSIDAGTRYGHRFAGWTVDAGGAVLADASSPKTSFAMPAADVMLTANWAALSVPLAPQNLSATPTGDCQVALAWAASADDGGSPVTNFELSIDGGATWTRLQPADPAVAGLPQTGDSLTSERLILAGTVIGGILAAGLILLGGAVVAYRRRRTSSAH